MSTRILNSTTIKLVMGAVIASGLLLLIPNSANARGAMSVSPPKFDFAVNPGTVIRDAVTFKNETDTEVTVFPDALNFTFTEGDEISGSPETYPGDEVRTGTEIAQWITLSKEPVAVPANSSYSLSYVINIPLNAQPGGYFGMIEMLVGGPGLEQTGVGVTGGLGSLIFLRVEGDTKEELNLTTFSGDKYVYRHLPVSFLSRLENAGNTHIRPVGNIFIRNVFGRQVTALTINPNFQTILPNSIRRFGTEWTKNRYRAEDSALKKEMKNFALGKYEATLFLSYGDGKTITGVYTFWVLPWLALAVWGGIAILVVLLLIFGLKGYNKMIIKKFQNKAKE